METKNCKIDWNWWKEQVLKGFVPYTTYRMARLKEKLKGK
jgi:hypothetical protein